MIVGLGNPTAGYANTRHNVGFMVADSFAKKHALAFEQGIACGQNLVVVKPLTYMNNSGPAVNVVKMRFGIDPADLLVVVDDADLPFGHIRLRAQGSAGTHKGLVSIAEALSTLQWPRLRIGIGHSVPLDEWVLEPFSKSEEGQLPDVLTTAVEAIEVWLEAGIETAMNQYNQRKTI